MCKWNWWLAPTTHHLINTERDNCTVIPHTNMKYITWMSTSCSNKFRRYYICENSIDMCGSNNPMKNFKIVNIFTPNNLRKCQSGEYILKTLICDNTFNCPTMDDELNCTKCDGLNNEIWNITCSVQLNNHIQKYLNEQIRKWKFPYLNKNNRANKINGTYFTCKDGTNISQHLVLDLYPDCPGTQAEDELLNSTMIIRDIIGNGHLCKEHSSIPCVKGHPKCYKKEKLCIYE